MLLDTNFVITILCMRVEIVWFILCYTTFASAHRYVLGVGSDRNDEDT